MVYADIFNLRYWEEILEGEQKKFHEVVQRKYISRVGHCCGGYQPEKANKNREAVRSQQNCHLCSPGGGPRGWRHSTTRQSEIYSLLYKAAVLGKKYITSMIRFSKQELRAKIILATTYRLGLDLCYKPPGKNQETKHFSLMCSKPF